MRLSLKPYPRASVQNTSEPIEEKEITSSTISPAPDDTETSHLKLLVADGPNPFRQRVVDTLNRIEPDLNVVVVDDGSSAMGTLSTFSPDMAIIGTAIENVYCFQICDYMRADERLKNALIIFASELHSAAWNCGEPETLHGADAWLSNSVSDDELTSGLRKHLEAVRSSHLQATT